MGQGLRRLRHAAGHGHAAARPVAAGDRARDGRPAVGGRVARGGVAAADPAPPARPRGRARLAGQRRHRARVHRLPRQLRGRLEARLPRHEPGQPLQRRLLAARRRAGRAAAAPDPQRDGGRRHDRRGRQGRVQPRPARDQLPLRRRAVDGRQPLDLQERREGDRRAGGHVAHLHGEVGRARGQLVPHPLLARAPRRVAAVRQRPAAVRVVRRRAARLPARADAVLRAEHQLVQALHARLVRADRRSPGARTTAPARCASSGTAPACASRTARRAPTSTRTWRSRR